MLNTLKHWLSPKPKRKFRLIQIEPSLQCGLECVMCPWSELRSGAGSMSVETFAQIQPYLIQAEAVDFTGGGEPLRNPNLTEMILAAKKAGCQVGFSTNATQLDPNLSQELIALGLDWISFSVDAAHPETYESIRQGGRFKTVIGNIAGMRDAKLRLKSQTPHMMWVFVMMTGEQENYSELPEAIRLAHSLGVENFIAKNLDVILKDGDDERRLFSHDGAPHQDVEAVLLQAEETASQLGVTLRKYNLSPQEQVICEHDPIHNLYVNWEGYVSPCISLSYADHRVFDGQRVLVPCQRFGSVTNQGLDEIWEQPAYTAFRQEYEARLLAQRRALIAATLDSQAEETLQLPTAPQGCQTCYYLYGI